MFGPNTIVCNPLRQGLNMVRSSRPPGSRCLPRAAASSAADRRSLPEPPGRAPGRRSRTRGRSTTAERVTATVGCCWRRSASHRAVQTGAPFGLAWILGLDVPDGLGLLSRRRACALGLRLLARFLVFAAATLRRLFFCQGDLPAIASRQSAGYPVESTRAKERACRGRVKQRSFLHARGGGHSHARPRCAGFLMRAASGISTSTRLACASRSPRGSLASPARSGVARGRRSTTASRTGPAPQSIPSHQGCVASSR